MKLKKIKNILSYYIRKEKLYNKVDFCGVKLKVLPNSIRKKIDKDDAWYFALAKNSENVFDLGCNIGYNSLIAAIQNKNKNILLVDPNPEVLAKAAQNMIYNGFGLKSKFISAFIGEKDGEKINFYTVGSGAAGSMYSSHATTAAAINSFSEVEKITIDTLVNKVGFSPDLIKIDVEGAEYLAVLGAKDTAAKQKTKFFIEMHSLKELPMKENAQCIINWCKENNYKAYYLAQSIQITDSEIVAKRGKCHFLLLPFNEDYPTYLKMIKEGDALPTNC
ncbi:FkbM family methyltransferase [Flavobacterium piscinae]|uniref:FkbM family methyltransferase n=2 Tax=Flavobacterium piscinae TaxID=2506424 RepID=A0A4Q1KUI0_9FLAO|nr:FkbM family methyltransferase [Flavobacterium piscinae]RXR33069.1 FkbM family methyltransferase [Flavobacterium piscinae]